MANDHLAQAFLFCGPRGVGKTTCARILARTINCADLADNFEACGKCEPCTSFDEGHSFNVHELDAASNNSVDDIRNLIDQVRLAPQVGTTKVYIIDEVHMLSASAFNAFLKTLEEPPAHAIFILATTEKHKIIPTILSRCQIFDFKRILVADMAEHLANVAKKENVEAEADALHLIAQKADGSLRDALSIFDQIVSYSGHELKYQHVLENLNILDYDHYFKMTDHILNQDIPKILLGFNDILDQGFDGHLFLNGLGAHFRDLLVSRTPSTIPLLEVSENIASRYIEQSKACDPELLIKGLEQISKADVQYKNSKDQRLLVELLLIKLCRLGGIPPQRTILQATSTQQAKTEEKKPEPEPAVNAPPPASTATEKAPVPKPEEPLKGSRPIAKVLQEGSTSVDLVEEEPAEFKKQPKPQAAPIDKPVSGNGPMASISINSMLAQNSAKEVENVDPEAVRKDGPKDPFTQEELTALWKKYALKRKNNGKNSLHATLNYQDPILGEDFKIVYSIMNEVQERDLKKEGPELLIFLKKELNNFSIELKWKKEKIDHRPVKPVNDMERFKILAKKNPALIKLKDELDLRIG